MQLPPTSDLHEIGAQLHDEPDAAGHPALAQQIVLVNVVMSHVACPPLLDAEQKHDGGSVLMRPHEMEAPESFVPAS